MCGPSRRFERHGTWTFFFPVAFAGTVYMARLVGEHDVSPRGAGLLALGVLSGLLLLAGLMRRRVLEVDEITGVVRVRTAGHRAGAGPIEHQAPAWAIGVERKPAVDRSRSSWSYWRGAPSLRFPDGARVGVTREEADRVRHLRLSTSARPAEPPGAPVAFVAGREAELIGRVHQVALVCLTAALLYLGLRSSLGVVEQGAAQEGRDLALFVLAFIAAVTGVARHFRAEARIVDGRAVEVRTTVFGVPLPPSGRMPFLKAVPDPRRRVLCAGPSVRLTFPQFPRGDPLSAAGATALSEAARNLRQRLEPVLALARDDAGAALYREPADMSSAATRAALVAPDAVTELQRTPRAIIRIMALGLSGAEATVVRVLRRGRAR